jgi:hypothetical protein
MNSPASGQDMAHGVPVHAPDSVVVSRGYLGLWCCVGNDPVQQRAVEATGCKHVLVEGMPRDTGDLPEVACHVQNLAHHAKVEQLQRLKGKEAAVTREQNVKAGCQWTGKTEQSSMSSCKSSSNSSSGDAEKERVVVVVVVLVVVVVVVVVVVSSSW